MDFRDKVFIAVAENLSLTKAAEKMYISQPAVTRHIRELESGLGISLFERKGNRVYLTLAGEITYSHLKKVTQLYSELDFALGVLKEEHKGVLRIGASSTISQYVIPSILASFHRKYPKIELNLFNGNSFEMEQKLLNNDLDLALVENSSSNSNLKYINFAEDNIIAIAGVNSPLARRSSLNIQDLFQIPMVLREFGSGTLEVIEKAFAEVDIKFEKLHILLHLGSTEAIKNFLTGFDGIAFVSERAIEKELLLKTLKKIQVNNLSIKRNFRIAQLFGSESNIPHKFIEFLFSNNRLL
jgi:DNA-binding transcriptional LysR family regulator